MPVAGEKASSNAAATDSRFVWNWSSLLPSRRQRANTLSNPETLAQARESREPYKPRHAARDAMMSVAVAQRIARVREENWLAKERWRSVDEERERKYRRTLHAAGLSSVGGVTAEHRKVSLWHREVLNQDVDMSLVEISGYRLGQPRSAAELGTLRRARCAMMLTPAEAPEDGQAEASRDAVLADALRGLDVEDVGLAPFTQSEAGEAEARPRALQRPYSYHPSSAPDHPRRPYSYRPSYGSWSGVPGDQTAGPAQLGTGSQQRPMSTTYADLTAQQRRPRQYSQANVSVAPGCKGKERAVERPTSVARQPAGVAPSPETQDLPPTVSRLGGTVAGSSTRDSAGHGAASREEGDKCEAPSNTSRAPSEKEPSSVGTDTDISRDASFVGMAISTTPATPLSAAAAGAKPLPHDKRIIDGAPRTKGDEGDVYETASEKSDVEEDEERRSNLDPFEELRKRLKSWGLSGRGLGVGGGVRRERGLLR